MAKHTHLGGGTRSEAKPPFHLVPRDGFRRTAQRFGLGAQIHGVDNWRKSFDTEEHAADFCRGAYDHMVEHTMKMADGLELDDDHLGAIGWAQTVLSYAETKFGKPWTQLGKTTKRVR
jgi:hypothetical protein